MKVLVPRAPAAAFLPPCWVSSFPLGWAGLGWNPAACFFSQRSEEREGERESNEAREARLNLLLPFLRKLKSLPAPTLVEKLHVSAEIPRGGRGGLTTRDCRSVSVVLDDGQQRVVQE